MDYDREENPGVGLMGLALAVAGGIGVAYYLKKRKAAAAAEPRVAAKTETPAPAIASDPYGNRRSTPVTPQTGAVEGFPGVTWIDVQVGINKVIRAINSGRAVMTAMGETPGPVMTELVVDGIVGPLTEAAMTETIDAMFQAGKLNTVEFRSPYMGVNAAMVPNGYVSGATYEWQELGWVPYRKLTSAANQTFEDRRVGKKWVLRFLWFAGKATYPGGETAPVSANMGAQYLLAKAAKG
jgi:hypothetical protein